MENMKNLCPQCGRELKDGAKFCTGCGFKIAEDAEYPNPQPAINPAPAQPAFTPAPAKKPKMSKRTLGLIIGFSAVALIAIVVLAIIGIYNSIYTTIDIQRAVSVSFEGANGYSHAEAYYDTDYMTEKLCEALDLTPSMLYEDKNGKLRLDGYISIDYGSAFTADMIIDSLYDYEITPDENISNGDEVQFAFTGDEVLLKQAKIKIKNPVFTVTASDLPEAAKIDPFEDIQLIYNGVSGKATLEIDKSACSQEIKDNIYFRASKTSRIKNGDVITVTARCDSKELLESYGIILTAESKEYTVSECGEYLTSSEGIDFTALQENMTQAAIENELVDIAAVQDITSDMLTPGGRYFVNVNGAGASDEINGFICFYSVPAEALGIEGYKSVYIYVLAENISKNADGTIFAEEVSAQCEPINTDIPISELEATVVEALAGQGAKITKL